MPKMQEHNRPKESSQRKGGPITAHVLRSSHLCPVGYLSGDGKRGFLPLCRRAASLPHPFRAIPDKYSGARRGKREKATLLRNVSRANKFHRFWMYIACGE